MGKMTIILSDEVEEQLRKYIAKKYPTETYGKISKIIEDALKQFLKEDTVESDVMS